MPAISLSQLFHISVGTGIFISSLAVFLLVLTGYNMIHRFNRSMPYFFSLVFLVITILLIVGTPIAQSHAPSGQGLHPGFLIGPFLLSISLAVINTLGYAPYVADYSRYLPKQTTVKSTFWYMYIGISISNIWMMLLGVVMQSKTPNSDPVTGFGLLGSHLGPWFRIGQYDIDAIFEPEGRYGKWNWVAILTYAIGFIVELPFMNTKFYEGVVAK